MDFQEYQRTSRQTVKYPNAGKNFIYPTLGLAGEAGEVAEKVKKIIRDSDGTPDADTREAIQKELGDVLWYVAQVATEFGLKLDDIASANIAKLQSRMERGKIGGSGDAR